MRSLFLIFIVLLASPLAAQDRVPMRDFEVVGVTAQIPAPPWLTDPSAFDASEPSENKGETDQGKVFHIREFYPEGQSGLDWTELYAVMGETRRPPSIEDAMQQQVALSQRTCATMGAQEIVSNEDFGMIAIFCGAYVNNDAQGEVAVFHFRHKGDVQVKAYYLKRGPAYDVRDPTAAPLSRAEGNAVIQRLAAFRLR